MSMFDQELLVASAQHHLYPNYRQPPLVMVRGQGSRLWDATGKEYLDLYAGIATSTLGHNHPRLVETIARQAGELIHLSNYYYNAPNVQLAERLCAVTRLDRALFCNSGTEAIEAMLKLARHHFYLRSQPERYTVIAFHNSFHGRTLGALACTGQSAYRDGFGPMPGVKHVAYGDLDAVKSAIDESTCAILVEPIQGEGGVVPAPEGFLEGLRSTADDAGLLLLADEIQTGVGRTGAFLAFHHTSVMPDAVAIAKGLAGGVPIGAMLCQRHLETALPPGSHGSTFGGSPLASAAALTVLRCLEDERLIRGAAQKGAHLQARLAEVARRQPTRAQAARGRGLLQALVLDPSVDARALQTQLREDGVLVTVAGGIALRITPPLTITTEELDHGVDAIDRALGSLP